MNKIVHTITITYGREKAIHGILLSNGAAITSFVS